MNEAADKHVFLSEIKYSHPLNRHHIVIYYLYYKIEKKENLLVFTLAPLPSSATRQAASDTMPLEREFAQYAQQVTNQPEVFDPRLFVLDNRILPEQVAFQDSQNPYIWLHPADFSPDRLKSLRMRLEQATATEYPPFDEDRVRNLYISTIRNTLKKDPSLSDVVPEKSLPKPLALSPYDYPLSHMVNGEPFPPVQSEAEIARHRDACVIYQILESELAERGYPKLLNDVVASLGNRGVAEPTAEQLFHELRDALGVGTVNLIRAMVHDGVNGVGTLLKVDKSYVNEIKDLMNYIAPRGFPLNDVINWQYGRTIPGMQGKSLPEVLDEGRFHRVDIMVESYQKELSRYKCIPEQRHNERLVAGILDHVPPLVAELFFEEGGNIVFTQEPDLSNLVNAAATGYHISYVSPLSPERSIHHIYISQDLGLAKTARTLVHELHHMFYPDQFISKDDALKADELLMGDEARLKQLKILCDEYLKGDDKIRQDIMVALNHEEFKVNGMNFFDATDKASMQTFIAAVNEAYHYLQMESPTYNRISSYGEPLDRFREVIPRYAEMRYVEYLDNKELMEFIAPGITQLYQEIYLPHLDKRMDYLHGLQGSKAQAVLEHVPLSLLEEEYTYTRPEHLIEREETHGDITITYPSGVGESVAHEFSETGSGTTLDIPPAAPSNTTDAATAASMEAESKEPGVFETTFAQAKEGASHPEDLVPNAIPSASAAPVATAAITPANNTIASAQTLNPSSTVLNFGITRDGRLVPTPEIVRQGG